MRLSFQQSAGVSNAQDPTGSRLCKSTKSTDVCRKWTQWERISGAQWPNCGANVVQTWCKDKVLHDRIPRLPCALCLVQQVWPGGGLVQQVWSSNELRLREIKAKYDPDNFFKCNRNIKPTAAAYPVHS